MISRQIGPRPAAFALCAALAAIAAAHAVSGLTESAQERPAQKPPLIDIHEGAENGEAVRSAMARAVADLSATKTLGGGALAKGVLAAPRVSTGAVALLTLLMAAATGLGAVPFFFFQLAPAWQGICNGIACGVMLAASFDLITEGQGHGGGGCVVLGIFLGGLFILVSQRVLDRFGDVKAMDLKGAGARRMLLIVAIMTLHSFGEGSGVGVSFAGPTGFAQGLLVTIAIAVHNVPEGLAVSMVMASRGVSPRNAMLWSIFTSLPQPLVAVPAFLCAEVFNQFLPVCVGFAAGCMIWMVFGEVMPEAFQEANSMHVASAATISVAVMEGVGTVLQRLEQPPSWEQMAPALWSLLFVTGPLLGGAVLLLAKQSMRLHPTLLSGLSAGMILGLALWRPLHLWLGAKMGFFTVLGLLYAGAFAYLALSRAAKWAAGAVSVGTGHEKGGGSGKEVLRHGKGAASLVALTTALVCGAVAVHALAEGLMLGVAAPHAEGLGMYMLLPVALHGLPRGMAAAAAVLGANRSGRAAACAAAGVGFAGPIGAWAAMAAGLDYRGLDYWMVFACGCMIPAALFGLVPRAAGVDRPRTFLGLCLGAASVVMALTATRVLCLSTPYCHSAPEAVT